MIMVGKESKNVKVKFNTKIYDIVAKDNKKKTKRGKLVTLIKIDWSRFREVITGCE